MKKVKKTLLFVFATIILLSLIIILSTRNTYAVETEVNKSYIGKSLATDSTNK